MNRVREPTQADRLAPNKAAPAEARSLPKACEFRADILAPGRGVAPGHGCRKRAALLPEDGRRWFGSVASVEGVEELEEVREVDRAVLVYVRAVVGRVEEVEEEEEVFQVDGVIAIDVGDEAVGL